LSTLPSAPPLPCRASYNIELYAGAWAASADDAHDHWYEPATGDAGEWSWDDAQCWEWATVKEECTGPSLVFDFIGCTIPRCIPPVCPMSPAPGPPDPGSAVPVTPMWAAPVSPGPAHAAGTATPPADFSPGDHTRLLTMGGVGRGVIVTSCTRIQIHFAHTCASSTVFYLGATPTSIISL
jgi:hypothetical protein